MDYRFLDRDEEIDISYSGLLPHWNQYGKIQFVTFRLFDSLPQSKIKELKEVRRQFLNAHPKPWDNKTIIEYRNLIGPVEERLLDNGYGSCILRNADVRKCVSDTLMYWDEDKYKILAYAIMPNHVHLLLQLAGETIESVMHSIKSYSARSINKALRREGAVWMREYYDTIIRSEKHLNNCISYIYNNPLHLRPTDYNLYIAT